MSTDKQDGMRIYKLTSTDTEGTQEVMYFINERLADEKKQALLNMEHIVLVIITKEWMFTE